MILLKIKLFLSLFLTFIPVKYAKSEEVVASWYETGKRTANGERFNPHGMTCAHKKLPFNTKLKLTHKNKSVIVRVNDRGPHVKGRTLDLAKGVKIALGCPDICKLNMEIIE